jgi:hypothetical protein
MRIERGGMGEGENGRMGACVRFLEFIEKGKDYFWKKRVF